jgi:two-component system sensor histidine kinase ChiS
MGSSLIDKYRILYLEMKKEKQELADKDERIMQEMQMATSIQKKYIPGKPPLDNIYSIYLPMEDLGGDYFDYLHFRGEDKIGIIISDVAGHGVPAAFITSMMKVAILQSGMKREDPAGLLFHLNDVLMHQVDETFITCFYGIYDYNNNHLLYSNAGHPPPLMITGDSVEKLPGKTGAPLAMLERSVMEEKSTLYDNDKIMLRKGTKLLMYTDGFSDATQISDKKNWFKSSIMDEVLMRHSREGAKEFVDNVLSELITFRGSYKFNDDICIVCVDVQNRE